jgi:hypothetical protein
MKGIYMLFAGILLVVLGMTFWHGWAAGLTSMGVFWVAGGALLIGQEAREKLAKRAIMSAVEQDKFWSEQLGKEE